MNGPLAVTIVVNWKRYHDTRLCLDSLAQQTYGQHRTVLIDNDSDDEQAHHLRSDYPSVHVIRNETNAGFAKACNQGIEWALRRGAAYVLLLNNDAAAEPDTVSLLIEHLQRDPGVGIAAPLITFGDRERTWYAGGRLNAWTGRTRHRGIGQPALTVSAIPRDTEFVTGCALMARADVLRALGGLDERYFAYFEDVDLCYRAKQAGHRLAVVPNARVAHEVSASAGHRGTSRLSGLQAYLLGRNKTLFAQERLRGLQRACFIAGSATIGALEICKRGRTLSAIRLYYGGMLGQMRGPEAAASDLIGLVESLSEKQAA